jgi:NTP pyrophosphatase (non-canonical NTP hydrolase)
MEFSDYQNQLKTLEHERGWDRVLPSHTFMHMGEELGEIARLLECLEGYRGTQLDRQALCQELAGELADLTAFVFKLASQHGIDMGRAMQDQLAKFMLRYQDIAEGQQEMARYVLYQERNLSWIKGEQDL